MITADQLLAHAIGDYLLQSDAMAKSKTRDVLVAMIHATLYMVPFFWLFDASTLALCVMWGTHVVIDRWRLARYVAWFKNWFWGGNWGAPNWHHVTETGYPEDRPAWLTVWLLIVTDNLLHVIINGLAMKYL